MNWKAASGHKAGLPFGSSGFWTEGILNSVPCFPITTCWLWILMVPSPSPNNSSLKDGYIVSCDSLCRTLRWIAQWYSDKHGYETGVLTSNMIQCINTAEPQCMFISQGLCALHANASSKSKLAPLSTRKVWCFVQQILLTTFSSLSNSTSNTKAHTC